MRATTKVNDTVVTTGWAEARVDELIAALPRQRWRRLSGGPGAHGERVYDWARVAIRPCWEDGFGH
ncbi:IS701 family transposase, partial [Streptomyces sp. NPDC002573]